MKEGEKMSNVNINDILKEYFNEDVIQENTERKTSEPVRGGIKAPDGGSVPKQADVKDTSAKINTKKESDINADNYKAIMLNYQLYCRTYIQSIRTVSDFIYYDYKKIIDQLNDNLAQQGKPAPQQQDQDNNQGEQQQDEGEGQTESAGEFNLDDYAGEMTAFDEMLADESVIGDVKNTAKDWLNSGESLVKYSKRKIKNKIDNALSDDDDKKKDDKSSVADKTKAIFRKHGVDV